MRPIHPERRKSPVGERSNSALRGGARANQPPARHRHAEPGRVPEPARRQLLTREEEIGHAKSIERGERALVDAIASSRLALEKLATLCEEVRGGTLGLAELVRNPPDAEHSPEGVASAILDAARGLAPGRPLGRQRARQASSGKPEAAARKRFVHAVLGYRLSRKAIDAIVLELEVAAHEQPRPEQAALAATASTIREAEREAEQARAILTQANLGLVVWMARRRGPQGFPAADLIQEGNLGLIRAVEKFDYRRGFRFNTYAAWWIRHFMNRALSDQSRVIRLPVHLLEARHRIARSAQEFRQRHGREPTLQELSVNTAIPVEKVSDILEIPPQPSSLDAPIHSDGDARSGDFVADDRTTSPVDSISVKEVQGRLREMLQSLTPREQEELALRFGIHGSDGVTLEQIGKRFSLSRERIRQIESEALAKLKKRAEAENLGSHLSE